MRLVRGILLLSVLGFVGAAPSVAAARVLEGERLHGDGKVVRDARASLGRAVELRLNGVVSRSLKTAALGAVLVRGRVAGCASRGALLVQVDGGTAMSVPLTRAFRERSIRGYWPAGTRTLRVSFASGAGKRCRARLDRLRLRATRRRPPAGSAPATGPVAPGGPAGVAPVARRAIPLGSSVVLKHLREDPAYEQALAREFVALTPENELKMNRIQPERGRFEFADADALVDYAQSRGKQLRGHTLIFGKETSAWVGRILFADEAEAALREHVRTVMTRYKGRIREWDVVNEALDVDGTFKSNAWFDKLGERYVEIAFAEARAVDPSARLFYNEFNAETNNPRRAGALNLARKLKAKGLIDGVGLQLHTSIVGHPKREEIEQTMRLFADAGLEVQVTEMDVIAKGDATPGSLAARLDLQAAVFRGAVDACQAVPACTRFNVWGVTDRYSWMGAEEIPLLLDVGYGAKPAFTAVRTGLTP